MIDEVWLEAANLFYVHTLERGWAVVVGRGHINVPGYGVPLALLKMYPEYITISKIRKITCPEELQGLMEKVDMDEARLRQNIDKITRDDRVVMRYVYYAV